MCSKSQAYCFLFMPAVMTNSDFAAISTEIRSRIRMITGFLLIGRRILFAQWQGHGVVIDLHRQDRDNQSREM